MRKFLLLAITIMSIHPLVAEDMSSIGKRLVTIVEHSVYALGASTVAGIIGHVAVAVDQAQQSGLSLSATQEFQELDIPLLILGDPVFDQPQTPRLLLAAAVAFGAIAAYQGYKVVEHTFALIRDCV